MGIKEELGEKIKRMRQNRGLTQEELSELVDISQRALSAIERGENFITSETLDKIIIALDTTSEEIFSTNHLKEPEVLLGEIRKALVKLAANPQKLEIIYEVVKALLKE